MMGRRVPDGVASREEEVGLEVLEQEEEEEAASEERVARGGGPSSSSGRGPCRRGATLAGAACGWTRGKLRVFEDLRSMASKEAGIKILIKTTKRSFYTTCSTCCLKETIFSMIKR